jgi:PAS domain S-box-containing protein
MSDEVTRWRSLRSVSPVGIFRTDADGECLDVNTRWCEITGLEREESLGQGWAKALHPDDHERITKGWSRAIREDRSFETKFRFQRPGGVVTPVLGQALPERDARGRICFFVGTITDLTEQIETENKLRRLALQLELEQQRERGRIARGLHDEVGQILAVTRAKLGPLIETSAGGDAPARAAEIRTLVDRAIERVRSLTFELSSPVLREIGFVAAVEGFCEQLGKDSGVQFRVTAEREPWMLDEDVPILLYRVVRELCINVVRHARALHAEVLVRVDGDLARIVVVDDGEGFNASQDARSFGPAGGFGLFAIREISRQLGGHFEIKSSPGKHTRAVLSVPLG